MKRDELTVEQIAQELRRQPLLVELLKAARGCTAEQIAAAVEYLSRKKVQ